MNSKQLVFWGFGPIVALVVWGFAVQSILEKRRVAPSPEQASEAPSFDKYVIGEELPGEIIAWQGYSGAFTLQDVKLDDGRVMRVASKLRVDPDVHQKVYIAESVWLDRSGQPLYVLTRYRK